jgi:regulator of protease activity HflC (stomatin/prohibitin superfamily)
MSAQAESRQTIVIGGRVFRRPAFHTNRVTWMWLGFLVMFALYWTYAIALERVDGGVAMTRWLSFIAGPETAAAANPPWIMRTAIEMFHPRVLRHFIPVIVGWWLSVEAATSLVQVLYDCPDRATARDFLRRQRRRNRPPAGPALAVTPQTLHRMEDESVELRVGGPAVVSLPTGHAGVTEWNSRFARVIGAGTQRLGSFEHIHSIIPLKPLDRSAENIRLMTKEGINVTTDAHIIFRIDPGDDPQTRNQPFPYSPEAVRKAAYSVVVRADGSETAWDSAPMGTVRGNLARSVGRYTLDELIFTDSSSRAMHQSIRNEVEEDVRANLKHSGIDFVRLQLGRFEPPPEVSEQYTEFWLASGQKHDQISRATGAASTLQEVQVAYAEAEITMLQAIVEGVRRAQGETDSASGYLLALRLVEVLDKMVQQSRDRLGDSVGVRDHVGPRLTELQQQLAQLESQVYPTSGAPGLPQDRLNQQKGPE